MNFVEIAHCMYGKVSENFSSLVYLDSFARTSALAGPVVRKIAGTAEKTEGWFNHGDDSRWQGWLAPNHWHQHPARYPSVDRQIRRPEDRRPVSGRPQCNHLRCWNGCSRPFPSLSTTLVPPASASPPDPGKSSLRPDYPSWLLIGIEILS